MAAEARTDVYHRAPRCLLRLFDAAAAGLADWSEFDAEAARLSIEVRGLSREGLAALIKSFTFEVPATEHRRLHREASDFVRWGRRGGLRILASYGRPNFSLLARFRWGRVHLDALIEHRAGSSKGPGHCDPPPHVYSWCPHTQSRKEASGGGDMRGGALAERQPVRGDGAIPQPLRTLL
jgi:hypothetical protein